MSREESEQLARCVAEVQDAYGVTVSPKTQALANLCAAVGGAYIPRVMLYNARKANEQRNKSQRNPTATAGMRQPQPQPQPQPQTQPQPQARASAKVVDIKTAGEAETPGQLYGFGFSGDEPNGGGLF